MKKEKQNLKDVSNINKEVILKIMEVRDIIKTIPIEKRSSYFSNLLAFFCSDIGIVDTDLIGILEFIKSRVLEMKLAQFHRIENDIETKNAIKQYSG